jgi:hypothetical protein
MTPLQLELKMLRMELKLLQMEIIIFKFRTKSLKLNRLFNNLEHNIK